MKGYVYLISYREWGKKKEKCVSEEKYRSILVEKSITYLKDA